jgi:hypothetical protein
LPSFSPTPAPQKDNSSALRALDDALGWEVQLAARNLSRDDVHALISQAQARLMQGDFISSERFAIEAKILAQGRLRKYFLDLDESNALPRRAVIVVLFLLAIVVYYRVFSNLPARTGLLDVVNAIGARFVPRVVWDAVKAVLSALFAPIALAIGFASHFNVSLLSRLVRRAVVPRPKSLAELVGLQKTGYPVALGARAASPAFTGLLQGIGKWVSLSLHRLSYRYSEVADRIPFVRSLLGRLSFGKRPSSPPDEALTGEPRDMGEFEKMIKGRQL